MARLQPGVVTTFFCLLFSFPCVAGSLEDGIAAHSRGDYSVALEILQPLAKEGVSEAQLEIAMIYGNDQGPLTNLPQAHFWASVAAARGAERAAALATALARRMTPGQLSEADRLVQRWRSTNGWSEIQNSSPGGSAAPAYIVNQSISQIAKSEEGRDGIFIDRVVSIRAGDTIGEILRANLASGEEIRLIVGALSNDGPEYLLSPGQVIQLRLVRPTIKDRPRILRLSVATGDIIHTVVAIDDNFKYVNVPTPSELDRFSASSSRDRLDIKGVPRTHPTLAPSPDVSPAASSKNDPRLGSVAEREEIPAPKTEPKCNLSVPKGYQVGWRIKDGKRTSCFVTRVR